MTSAPPPTAHPQAPPQYLDLAPLGGSLYVVRWPRYDGTQALHRYYRRRPDAVRYAERLRDTGITARVFIARVAWTEVPA